MGTDIHGIWQAKKDGKWVDVPCDYDEGRHYQLFAALADVRNGYGFAGVKTGGQIEPISFPKGYPEDFEVCDDDHPITDKSVLCPSDRKYQDDDDFHRWMGDHSHSWLTGSEMLGWFEKERKTIRTGIVSKEVFEEWDRVSAPKSWCGGVGGPGIVVVDYGSLAADWTHIRVSWEENLNESLKYFFAHVYSMVREHGEVRYVFGFDS